MPTVAEATQATFERLRLLHSYGVLSYNMFTAADDLAHLAIEQALRDRFLEFHGAVVPFEDAQSIVHEVTANTFDALYEEIHADNRLRRPQRWRLRVLRTDELMYFDGMLESLLRWARAEGLLRGQRNRRLEPVLKKLRNHVAHGTGGHLVMPVDSARTISDVGEITNHLWGSPTPGGRLYPAPIRREIQAVAWSPDGSGVASGLASLSPDRQFAGWTTLLVRAVLHDDGLSRLDSCYETTTYPCDLLWGPGSWGDASSWLEQEHPAEDDVDVLDRLFLFQLDEGHLHLPRCPDVAAGLTEAERQGTWYVLRADFPGDAIAHARGIIAGRCSSNDGPCGECPAETVGAGTWQEVIELVLTTGTRLMPRRPPDIRVPSIMAWPRYFNVTSHD